MTRIFYIVIVFFIFFNESIAQTGKDSINIQKINQFPDSVLISKLDSSINDSLKDYNISKDAFEESIEWGAKDMVEFRQDSNKMLFFDEGFINYRDLALKAGFLEIDNDKSEILGLPMKDKTGKEVQRPKYKDKTDEFEARKLRYNLKSKKAWVEYATKKEGELTVHGEIGKYITKEADTLYKVDKMFLEGGIITNCTNDHPHWGIRASKIKLIPNKLAIFGYSMFQIADVPIYPLTLPFGFYPIFQGQKSGLILPRNVDIDTRQGVGFKDIGIYLVLNDYVDIRATVDIYTRGTHGIKLSSNYAKRYKFRGSVGLSYYNTFTELTDTVGFKKSPSFGIDISHNQDSKANPYQTIGGRINLQFSNFQKQSNNDFYSQTNNIIGSNMNYTRRFPGSPFNLSASFNHSQNTKTRDFDVTFPRLAVNMNTIYPFKVKNRTGQEKWFEKISLKYDAFGENQINATDTTIFLIDTIRKNMKTGLKQSLSSNATFNLFKYINIGFNLNYDENHYFKITNKYLKDTLIFKPNGKKDDIGNILYDTLHGQLITETISDWKVFRNLAPSISLSTNRYGKIMFSKGYIRGIKHKVSYSISASGNPFDQKDKFIKTVDTDTRPNYNKVREYNILELGGPYGVSYPGKRNITISYGINNYLEAKVFSKKDSTLKKISLLKGLSISGYYNVFDDSLNFSPISASFNVPLFKNFVLVTYSSRFDVYEKVDGKRINRFVWNSDKFPFRHDYTSMSISVSNKSFEEIINMFRKKPEEKDKNKDKDKSSFTPKEDKLLSILKDFRLRYDINMQWLRNSNNIDTFIVNYHSISVNGSIPLSKNWSLRINNFDYNLKDKRFEYPDIGLERDLHCWRMSFSWRPSAGSYTFFIGVKSSVLQFVKYNHGQDPVRGAFGSIPGF